MTEKERKDVEYEKAKENLKKDLWKIPFMLAWFIIKEILMFFLGVLGLTGTAVKAYNSAERRR